LKDISLTTNGILLAAFAREIYDAGINRINVSLDSLNKDKYFQITRGGNLDDVCVELPERRKSVFHRSRSIRWPSKVQ